MAQAWSPARLFRLGRGPRLLPVPTNLCVLAERPNSAASPDGGSRRSTMEKAKQQTPQQKHVGQLPRDALGYHNHNEIDLTAETLEDVDVEDLALPNLLVDEMEVYGRQSQVHAASRSEDRQLHLENSQLSSSIEENKEDDVNNKMDGEDLDHQVRNLSVPQIHLPPRLVPNVAWEHHHRATTSFVHERLHRRRGNNPGDLLDDQDNDDERNGKSSDNIDARRRRLVSATKEWKLLEEHQAEMEDLHLRDLLADENRSRAMYAEHDGVYLDYSRQRATFKTLELLQDLARKQRLEERIKGMMSGEKINFTEKRAVLHTALRADRSEEIYVDDVNVVEEVHQVLDQIKAFSEGVRNGDILGYTGKRLRNIISVGIGGSYLGPEFLHEVLKTEPEGVNSALGYNLRFLANVDPVDVERTCADLDPEETLIIIVSKTFTTAETMLNARTMRQWLWDFMGNDKDVVRKHVVACASISSKDKVEEFGIDTAKYFFRFWDWVGGRYSVCSAVGAVPISLMYGFDLFEQFLKVCRVLLV